MFNFRKEKVKKEISRSEIFSELANAKQSGQSFVCIDGILTSELCNELKVMGCLVYPNYRFSNTHIYLKN